MSNKDVPGLPTDPVVAAVAVPLGGFAPLSPPPAEVGKLKGDRGWDDLTPRVANPGGSPFSNLK